MSERPKPHRVPPHICGHPTYGLSEETLRHIDTAVYGPRNWLNVDALRRHIAEVVKHALEKGE